MFPYENHRKKVDCLIVHNCTKNSFYRLLAQLCIISCVLSGTVVSYNWRLHIFLLFLCLRNVAALIVAKSISQRTYDSPLTENRECFG